MKTKPVKRYRQPRYPTRLQVISDPDLLARNVPPAWRSVPGMAGSIALFLAANSLAKDGETKTAAPAGAAAVVAPIFDHGEGRGATGCIVMAPPVFLSEEEAWQVIDEELSKQGVKLGDTNLTLRGVQIPRRMENMIVTNGKATRPIVDVAGSAKPFTVDRENAGKHIALEFVSERDYHSKAGGPFAGWFPQTYDFRQTAGKLAEDISKQAQEKVYLGVLYDPLTSPPAPSSLDAQAKEEGGKAWVKAYLKSQQVAATESKRLLRLQVQDFIKWLQAQGAI
jgi:hypothetical protein